MLRVFGLKISQKIPVTNKKRNKFQNYAIIYNALEVKWMLSNDIILFFSSLLLFGMV